MEIPERDGDPAARIPKRARLDDRGMLHLDTIRLVIWDGRSKLLEVCLSMYRSRDYPSPASYSHVAIQKSICDKLASQGRNPLPDNVPFFVDAEPRKINDDYSLTMWLTNILTNPEKVLYEGEYNTVHVNIQDPTKEAVVEIGDNIETVDSLEEAGDDNEAEEAAVILQPEPAGIIDLTMDDDEQVEDGEPAQDVTLDGLSTSTQFDPSIWEQCCQLFNHDVRKMSKNDSDKCHLKGTNLNLYPHQLYSVFWMLTQPERNNMYGGLIADDMGLGKTYQGMGFIAARSMILWCKDDVATHPDAHLQLSSKGKHHSQGNTCPSDYKFGVQCYCQKSAITRSIADYLHSGPTMVIAPVNVVHVWCNDLSKGLNLDQEECKFRLHTLVSNNTATDELNRYGLSNNAILSLKAEVINYSKKTRYSKGQKYTEIKFHLKAKPGQHSQVILLNSHMIKSLRNEFRLDRNNSSTEDNMALMPGAFLLDEIHLFKGQRGNPGAAISLMNDTARAGKVPLDVSGCEAYGQPMAFGFSATPAEKSPMDFYNLVDSILKAGAAWDDKSVALSLKQIEQLSKTCDRLKRGRSISEEEQSNADWRLDVQNYQEELAELTNLFVIRRTRIDKFGGYKICDEKPIEPTIIKLEIPEQYMEHIKKYEERLARVLQELLQERIDRWERTQQGQKPTMESVKEGQMVSKGSPIMRLLRIFSSFPAVARLHCENGRLDFSTQAIAKTLQSIKSSDDAKQTPYYKDIDQLVMGSGKINQLMAVIQHMRSQRTPHKYDNETIPRNLVLFCSIPANLLLIYLYLLKHADDLVEIMFAHGTLKDAQRSALTTAFKDWQGAGSENKKCKILLTSTYVLGFGTSLTRANYCITFDLPYMLRDLAQSLGRVSRAGQKEQTFLYVFLGVGCVGEDSVRDRQEFRKLLSGENKSIQI